MTIRDVEASAPPQHFDISATPAEATADLGYVGEDEITVGPTAYATPIHDDHDHVPIIQATSLPTGGIGGPPPPEAPQFPYNSTGHSPIAVVTGPPQPPRVNVVTGAPQPPTPAPTAYYTSNTQRSGAQKCCIFSAATVGVICCLCCILPVIIVTIVWLTSGEYLFDDDDYYDNSNFGFDDDFFDNDNSFDNDNFFDNDDFR